MCHARVRRERDDEAGVTSVPHRALDALVGEPAANYQLLDCEIPQHIRNIRGHKHRRAPFREHDLPYWAPDPMLVSHAAGLSLGL